MNTQPTETITLPAKDPVTKDVLTAADVAARLGVGQTRVRQMIRAGQLPAVKVGKRGVRIPRAAFEQHLAAMTAASFASYAEPFAAALKASCHPALTLLGVLAPSAEQEAERQESMDGMAMYLKNSAPRR